MKLLLVDACPRRAASRTLKLAHTFLAGVRRACPQVEVVTHCLPEMGLPPVDEAWLAEKEAACDQRTFHLPMFAPVQDLQQADGVVVAAPYWDLSFPSMLKVWVEHMYVRNLTFRYENDKPVGLCPCRASVYIATAGSPIADMRFGSGYLHAALDVLGIKSHHTLTAEALDLSYSDPAAILADAADRALALGEQVARELG